jgi:predicted SprT family Zn-dependent metalloprotease
MSANTPQAFPMLAPANDRPEEAAAMEAAHLAANADFTASPEDTAVSFAAAAPTPTDAGADAATKAVWQCQLCGSNTTCRKRKHPMFGPSTLCNACGVRLSRQLGSTNIKPTASAADLQATAQRSSSLFEAVRNASGSRLPSPALPVPTAANGAFASGTLSASQGTLPPLCAEDVGAGGKPAARARKPTSKRAAERPCSSDSKGAAKQTIALDCARCGPTRTPMKRHHHSFGNADLCNACGVSLRRLDERDRRARLGLPMSSSGDAGDAERHRRPGGNSARSRMLLGRNLPPPTEVQVEAARKVLASAAQAERDAQWGKRRRACLEHASWPLQMLPDSELQRQLERARQRVPEHDDTDTGGSGGSGASTQSHIDERAAAVAAPRIAAFVAEPAPFAQRERLAVTQDGRDVAGRVADDAAYRRVYGFQPTVLAKMTQGERASAVTPPAPPGKKVRVRQARRARQQALEISKAHLVLERARAHALRASQAAAGACDADAALLTGVSRPVSPDDSPASIATVEAPKAEPAPAPDATVTISIAAPAAPQKAAAHHDVAVTGEPVETAAPMHEAPPPTRKPKRTRAAARTPLPPLRTDRPALPPCAPAPAAEAAAAAQPVAQEVLVATEAAERGNGPVGAVKEGQAESGGVGADAPAQRAKVLRPCALCRQRAEPVRDGFCRCALFATAMSCRCLMLQSSHDHVRNEWRPSHAAFWHCMLRCSLQCHDIPRLHAGYAWTCKRQPGRLDAPWGTCDRPCERA